MNKKAKKPVEKTYCSIRIVKAKSRAEAIEKVEDGKFEETHSLCDVVMTRKELKKLL